MTALFWKTTAGILIAVVLVLAVGKQEKDLAMILTMATCVMVGITSFAVLEPVVDFLYRLAELGNFRLETLKILMKITGIGIISELAQMICKDSGNTALSHGMQMLGTAMILLLSLPVLEMFLELLQQILGEL